MLNWNDTRLRVVRLVNDSIQQLAANCEKNKQMFGKVGRTGNNCYQGTKAASNVEANESIVTFNSINEKSK